MTIELGERVWTEDDATTRDPDHEDIDDAWLRMFGAKLDTKQAVEHEDCGDADCWLMPSGYVAMTSYAGNCAIYKSKALEASLASPARPSWDATFLGVAAVMAKRTTCVRAIEAYGGIGAVLVEQGTHVILGVGYTGSQAGQPHCTDVGCDIAPESGCQRTLHAEMNAILHGQRSRSPQTLYSTASPCLKCCQAALKVGVRAFVFEKLYRIHEPQVQLCAAMGATWTLHAGVAT